MSRTAFLIGPSRIGKSSAGRRVASSLPQVRHHDLDMDLKPFRIAGVDNVVTAQDWSILRPLLEGYETLDGRFGVVDVGAGTQNMVEQGNTQIVDWLRRPSAVVVLLTANVEFAWTRWIWGRPEMESLGKDRFVEQEFTCRTPLYAIAHHEIDVTNNSCDEVAQALAQILVPYTVAGRDVVDDL